MVPNIYFWRNGGDYFQLTASIVPLLHTWSLGVEEQFYLLFPATLIIAERLRLTRTIIAVLALGSFAIGAVASYRYPVAAFYLLPARGWELMIGAALAVNLASIPERVRPAAGLVGLALIALGFLTISEADLFPGWVALLPTVGAALLIGSGTHGPASRMLSSRPIVYVGKISYSLYLWHWPVFVFMRHWQARTELPPALSAAGILLAFVLSAISYRWLEQPARNRRTRFRPVLVGSLAGSAAVVAVSATALAAEGLPQRFDPRVVAIAAQHSAFAPLAHACSDVRFDYAIQHCRLGAPGKPSFLLWGDSRAAAISEGVENAFGQPGLVLSTGACPPTSGWSNPAMKSRDNDDCSTANARALDFALQNNSVRRVVLNAYWPAYAKEGPAAFWGSVQQLVDRLNASGKGVIVVAGEPAAAVDVPWASAIRQQFGRSPIKLSCPRPNVPLRHVTLVDVAAPFCTGTPYRLLTDDNHPSRYAGLTIIEPAVRSALGERGQGVKETVKSPN
jgi:hypothetical protein